MSGFFSNLKLAFKILIPVAVLVLAAVGIVLLSQHKFGEVNTRADIITSVTAPRLAEILELESNVNAATIQEKNVLLAHTSADQGFTKKNMPTA